MQTTPAIASAAATRHPLDPDPVRSTKAPAVFALGLVAVLTGPLLGGIIPATTALLLAEQARRQAYASGGYLTGGRLLRGGERLAWAGIVLAATTLVMVMVIGVLHLAANPLGQDFAPTVD